jgi:zinc/manganese transport system permease protein/manganese/iron transport system permease protein
MIVASAFGTVAVGLGLLCSWHAGTAAGASIAAAAIALAVLSSVGAHLVTRLHRPAATTARELTPIPVSASPSGK